MIRAVSKTGFKLNQTNNKEEHSKHTDFKDKAGIFKKLVTPSYNPIPLVYIFSLLKLLWVEKFRKYCAIDVKKKKSLLFYINVFTWHNIPP